MRTRLSGLDHLASWQPTCSISNGFSRIVRRWRKATSRNTGDMGRSINSVFFAGWPASRFVTPTSNSLSAWFPCEKEEEEQEGHRTEQQKADAGKAERRGREERERGSEEEEEEEVKG